MAPVTSPNYAATVTAKCGYPNMVHNSYRAWAIFMLLTYLRMVFLFIITQSLICILLIPTSSIFIHKVNF